MPAGPEGIPAVYEVNGREYLAFSARPSLKHLGPGGERATVEASPGAPETQGFYVFALPEPAHK
jgi:quinoprotein glucose dehydrogenase